MVATLYPGAVFKPVSYRGEAGKFTKVPWGWILHVVVGNGSPYGTFQNAVSPNRRFSHFWISKSGAVEQYQTLDMRSWAQGTGNDDYYSCETEGLPTEPLTTSQIQELAKIHNFLGSPDVLADQVGESGIGVHYMGGQPWGGHTCPDPDPPGYGPRSRQRAAIIALAKSYRGADDMPTTDEIAKDVWATAFKEYIDEDGNGIRDARRIADIVYSAHLHAVSADRKIDALSAKLDQIATKLG